MTDRGRVPFALVGVLLLASSATLAPAFGPGRPTSEPAVDTAIDQLRSETTTVVRQATHRAARQAARNPVTRRANTSVGRVLNRTATFRDALRLRIYLAVREGLRTVSGPSRGLSVEAELPSTETPAALRAAKRRVHLAAAGSNDTALRVRIENVTLRGRRGGQVVARETVSPSLVVATPVLAVHDRVARYEQLLEAGPLSPGLGRRLTAALYPLTWARGYAQYRGAPIQNVLGNRHVGLFANRAILELQRAVFGSADPVGRRVLASELARVGTADVLAAGAEQHAALAALNELRTDPVLRRGASAVLNERVGVSADARVPSPSETATVGVNASADRAFLATLERLNRTIARTYTARARLRGRVAWRRGSLPPRPRPPGPGWTLLEVEVDRDRTVERREATPRAAPGDWHLLAAYPRVVETRVQKFAYWQDGTETRLTMTTGRRRTGVTVRVEGNHYSGPGPVRPIAAPHEPRGPNASRQFAGVETVATDRLLTPGVGAIAKRIAAGSTRGRNVTIRRNASGVRRDRLVAELVSLRDRLRNVTVSVRRGRLATLQATPARALLSSLERRRDRLVGAPATYDSVAQRARDAARVVMLNRTIARLQARASRRSTASADLARALPSEAVSLRTLQEGYDARHRQWRGRGPGSVEMEVEASPSYLTTSEVSHNDVPAIRADRPEHPLVLSNVNIVSVPYGDAADFLTSILAGPTRVSFRTAGQVLAAARELRARGTETALETDALAAEVRWATDQMAAVLAAKLRVEGYRDRERADRVVSEGLDRWPTPSARALAIANGSLARAVADAATRRGPSQDANRTGTAVLAVRLRETLRRARAGNLTRLRRALDRQPGSSSPRFGVDVRPRRGPINRTAAAVRRGLESELRQRLDRGLEAVARRALEAGLERGFPHLPAGLPLAPLPGLWYATVNAWLVQARGEYARFAVRVPRGTPLTPGGSLTYVRDGVDVALDVDSDGASERLGRAARVDFDVSTVIGIAVPPGGTGVGDVDGQTAETSPGWDRPGPK